MSYFRIVKGEGIEVLVMPNIEKDEPGVLLIWFPTIDEGVKITMGYNSWEEAEEALKRLTDEDIISFIKNMVPPEILEYYANAS
ncbi:hypothetical protein [Sanyastnella coralliicola]|uniref:hypothetical protein n=1 Tax=Sanyastnella coralliicola TaxID=3069118 RepID=UPI0027B9D7BC|nr:hypothetical protein [Longitalea sp. SCSIO 12813]